MATIKDKNLAWVDLSGHIKDGDIVENCNCARVYSGSSIPNATYIGCNLMNADTTGRDTQNCLVVQKDLCYWLHETLDLPVEVGDCRHVVESYEADIDGLIETLHVRKDTVL